MTHSRTDADVVYEFGAFRLDPLRRLLLSSADGSVITVPAKVFDTLLHLLERRGELIDKHELMKSLWPSGFVDENNLNQCISALRRIFGERPGDNRYIVTVPGRGYRFVAPLVKVDHRDVSAVQSAARVGRTQPTTDLEAYQLYLQGIAVRNKLGESNLRRAIELFEHALERDPQFARAYSAKAFAHFIPVTFGYPVAHALEAAQSAAEQALALAPGLAEAQAIVGNVHAVRGRWLEAESCFRRAIALDPNDDFVRRAYVVNVATNTGHLRRAFSEMQEAYRLAPADPLVLAIIATVASLLDRDTEALKYASLSADLHPGSPVVAIWPRLVHASAATRAGRHAEASGHVLSTLPPNTRAAGGVQAIELAYAAMADAGQAPAALAALQSVVDRDVDALNPALRTHWIQLFAMLGSLDRAFELANSTLDLFAKAGALGNSWGPLWSTEMRPFRRDARFQGLIARMQLVEFWAQHGPPDGSELRDGQLICV